MESKENPALEPRRARSTTEFLITLAAASPTAYSVVCDTGSEQPQTGETVVSAAAAALASVAPAPKRALNTGSSANVVRQ